MLTTYGRRKTKGTKRKFRPKKDPAAPKRPRSAYILFCTEKRDEVKEGIPDAKPADIMKSLGELWKQMDENDREKYKERAEADKERYAEEMKRYVPSDGYNPDGTPKPATVQQARQRDPNMPKRALSAYIIFGQAKREEIKREHPDARSPDIMKLLGERWRGMTDEEKQPYVLQSNEDRKRYKMEKEAYDKNKADAQPTPLPAHHPSDDDDESDEDSD